MELLGSMCLSLADFKALEPKEIVDLIDKRSSKIKYEHYLQYIATVNAIGISMSSDYEYFDIFDTNTQEEQINKSEYTNEEQEALLDYFSNW